MSPVYDCTTEEGRAEGVARASEAVRAGEVVVLPTDTVYGIGADAFSPEAVASVLAAKGRGREMPPPVLVPSVRTVDGLAADVPSYARDLIKAFWPGPLTLVLTAQSSLMWDLGETNGTVALRMPEDDVALALLSEVGPMAVTSANLTGRPPAKTVVDAATQLGAAVSVYLDGGPATGTDVSTILDCTGEAPVVLRVGAISQEQIDEVLTPETPADSPSDSPSDSPPDTPSDSPDDAIELPADPTDESTLQETTDER
jgi:tRNA threonylcarbamoyl adenosine modification protein (Sua5/YciO/YrdC/YwlC family)